VIAQVYLPIDDVMQYGRVRKRARYSYKYLPGHVNNNPMLDTGVYKVSLGDGTNANYASIVESMYT